MNIPEWALGTLLVFSSLLFAQGADSVLQSTSSGTAGLLKINLPGCPQLSDTDSVYSYTGNSDGCEWFGIAARQPDIKIVVQEPLLSSEGDRLLVSGHYLDIDSTRQTYPQLTGKSLNTSVLANTDSQLPAVKVISPVLEVYGSRESMFLLYEEHEKPLWQWVRVNATRPEGMLDSERRFSLYEGESLHLSSCGFDLVVQAGIDAPTESEAIVVVSEQHGQLMAHEWTTEPQDMDGGGKNSGATGTSSWWGGSAGASGFTYAQIFAQTTHQLKLDDRKKGKDDDDDPEDKKGKPKILSQCEASAVPLTYDKMNMRQLQNSLRKLGDGEHTEAERVVRAAVERCENSRKRGSKMSRISPNTMWTFDNIVRERRYIISNDLKHRLRATMR